MSRKRNKKSTTPVVSETGGNGQDKWHLVVVSALCAIGFLLYLNTLSSTFHFDDFSVIVTNPAIRNFWDLSSIFNAFNTRFLTGWTFAANYALGQLDVFGYHFLNIWLHVCNASLVYALILQLLNLDGYAKKLTESSKIWIACVCAAIFLVHPIQTQAVNYVWQRSTLLASFFYLNTLVLYIYSRVHKSRAHYWVGLCCCVLAMFSKEISFTLPVMLVVVECLFLRWVLADQRSFRWLMPFVLTLMIIPIALQRTEGITLQMMRPYSLTQGVADNVMSRQDFVMTQVNVVGAYLKMFIIPVGQSVDHEYPLFSRTGWGWWLCSLGLLLMMAVIGIRCIKSKPIVSIGIFWFFITLSIESWVTSKDLFVEHRMYLPAVGISLLLAFMIYQLLYIKFRRFATVVVLILFVILGALTVIRNRVWMNDVTLWSDAIVKFPHKARAYNNRAVIYKKMGFLDLAIQDLSRATDIDPKFAEAYYNRGNAHKAKGDFDLAAADFSKVMELEPGNAQAYDARGYIYRRKEMFKEALLDFAESIKLNPNNPEVFNNRAYIHQKQGNIEDAINDYTRAIEADPGYVYAYNNRGNLYLEIQEYERAVKDYSRAISLKPDFGEPLVNRAVAYFRMGRFEESRRDVKAAEQLKVKPNPEFIRQLNAAPAN